MTEDEIYTVLLANGPAGDAKRYNGQPSMIERIARRQAKALIAVMKTELGPDGNPNVDGWIRLGDISARVDWNVVPVGSHTFVGPSGQWWRPA